MVHNAVSESVLYSPQTGLILSEETERAQDMLSTLPDSQREVVCLRIQHGLKFREIANVQGVSSITVRGRYRYAISRLKGLTGLNYIG